MGQIGSGWGTVGSLEIFLFHFPAVTKCRPFRRTSGPLPLIHAYFYWMSIKIIAIGWSTV